MVVDLRRYLIDGAFLSLNSKGVEMILEDVFEMGREVVVLGNLEDGASYLAEAWFLVEAWLLVWGFLLRMVALREEVA